MATRPPKAETDTSSGWAGQRERKKRIVVPVTLDEQRELIAAGRGSPGGVGGFLREIGLRAIGQGVAMSSRLVWDEGQKAMVEAAILRADTASRAVAEVTQELKHLRKLEELVRATKVAEGPAADALLTAIEATLEALDATARAEIPGVKAGTSKAKLKR